MAYGIVFTSLSVIFTEIAVLYHKYGISSYETKDADLKSLDEIIKHASRLNHQMMSASHRFHELCANMLKNNHEAKTYSKIKKELSADKQIHLNKIDFI
jgi:hypothetical protein